MRVDELLQDDDGARDAAVSRIAAEPHATREALAPPLAGVAADGALALVDATDAGDDTDVVEARLDRAVRALAHLDVPAARQALLDVARHGSPVVRKRVASGLFSARTDDARAALVELVGDADPEVRDEAAGVVLRAPWAAAAGPLLAALDREGIPSEHTTRALAATAALSGEATRAVVAARLLAIARWAPHQARPVDRLQCTRALDALVESGATFPGVQEAAAELARSEDLRTRLAGVALQAGGGHGGPLATLLELAATGSTDESAIAAVHLRRLPAAIVAAGIRVAMRADDPRVRARAASLAVGTIVLAREASLESLVALTHDPDAAVREAAVRALARCLPAGRPFFLDRKERVADALDALADDPATEVAQAVANAKAVLGVG